MRSVQQQEYNSPMRPDLRFTEPNMSFDGVLNDTFYQALPEDKREAYKDSKLDEMAQSTDDTTAKAILDAENTDFIRMN